MPSGLREFHVNVPGGIVDMAGSWGGQRLLLASDYNPHTRARNGLIYNLQDPTSQLPHRLEEDWREAKNGRIHLRNFVMGRQGVAILRVAPDRSDFALDLPGKMHEPVRGDVVAATQNGTSIYVLSGISKDICLLTHFHSTGVTQTSITVHLQPSKVEAILSVERDVYVVHKKKSGCSSFVLDTKCLSLITFPRHQVERVRLSGPFPGEVKPWRCSIEAYNRSLWCLTSEDGDAGLRNSFWRLPMDTLSWLRIRLDLLNPIRQPVLHILPSGLALLGADRGRLLSFWVEDVPSLGTLAFAVLTCAYPKLASLPTSSLLPIGLPLYYAESL